ncbi:hypothetical protein GIB67_033281 [Kingdonia uniflora]|uniref:Uncharacterized protein n=1 Tax=Kingdonia uniflora TaxID=39325 RepID=A0A7J7LJU8_9MAGN|nr:hypothetical protein GIB67_033281 [Kingdonia uniflora]
MVSLPVLSPDKGGGRRITVRRMSYWHKDYTSSYSSWVIVPVEISDKGNAVVQHIAIVVVAGAHTLFTFRRSSKFKSHVVGIIPARYASSRFEGKPLVQILGKPMIQDARALGYVVISRNNLTGSVSLDDFTLTLKSSKIGKLHMSLIQVFQDLLNCLDSPELPFLQWQEIVGNWEMDNISFLGLIHDYRFGKLILFIKEKVVNYLTAIDNYMYFMAKSIVIITLVSFLKNDGHMQLMRIQNV